MFMSAMEDDKINSGNGCSGEDEEEMKIIERFFALIRSFREARNRCRRREELYGSPEKEKKKKKKMKRVLEDDKINSGNGCSGEDEEEMKIIERFFALIRSFREARNRCRRREELYGSPEKEKKKKKKMKRVLEEKQSNWIPSFEREDFTTQVEFRGTPEIFPAPCSNVKDEHPKQPEQEDALDLKLSL